MNRRRQRGASRGGPTGYVLILGALAVAVAGVLIYVSSRSEAPPIGPRASPEEGLVKGAKDAPVTIVEYSDFQ